MGRTSARTRAATTFAAGSLLFALMPAGVASAAPAVYQAESGTLSKAVVESNHAGYTGTGFVNFDNVVGSHEEFTVNAATAGSYSLDFRFANGTTEVRPMSIEVNGTVVNASLAFPGTGAWTTWADQTMNAPLVAGVNKIRATSTTTNGGPNFDKLTVDAPGGQHPPEPAGRPELPGSRDRRGHDPPVLGRFDRQRGRRRVRHLPRRQQVRRGSRHRDRSGADRPHAQFHVPHNGFRPRRGRQRLDRQRFGDLHDETEFGRHPPSAPSGLTFSNPTTNTVNLAWTGSTDDRAVTAYDVRSGTTAIHSIPGTPPPTSEVVPNLTCATTYTLNVTARDAAGNVSGPSNTVTFTTGSCSRGVPQTPTTVSSGWDVPWDISFLPDGKSALITQRDKFNIYKQALDGTKTLVGSVPNSTTTNGEGGLMGLAVSPTWNGITDKDVFIMHTSNDGGTTQNRVVKMQYDGTTLSGRTVIVSGIRSSLYHNGGRLRFGPDGYLYLGTGDSQQGNLAQNLSSLNGKVLRFTRAGAAAPGNPFGTLVYSYGHRNPQGLAWDSAGRLREGELGQSSQDELNLILPGKNYGWPTCEGSCSTPGMENPKKTWSTSSNSPSGIAIVNDTVYMCALKGARLYRVELNGTSAGATSSYFVGTYGRLRVVVKVPGASAIWFSTTNSDNNGNGTADRILRSEIR